MSITTRRNEVARHQKASADLQKKIADEMKKEVAKVKSLNTIERSITNSTSTSMLRSKQQQITRIMDEIAKIQAKKADFAKKLSDSDSKLGKAKDALAAEEERERKRLLDAEKKREREQLSHQRAATSEQLPKSYDRDII